MVQVLAGAQIAPQQSILYNDYKFVEAHNLLNCSISM